MTINFDMDGTIVNLYGIHNWLHYLENEDVTPYIIAKPMLQFNQLARKLNALQKQGHKIAIISWTSKSGTQEYNEAVANIKRNWLARHLPSVKWDRIIIVPYGTPKQNFCENPLDILFDDETKNRDNWTGRAYDVNEILKVLGEI